MRVDFQQISLSDSVLGLPSLSHISKVTPSTIPDTVFLQHQFSEFRLKESEPKMINILQKTWSKMGDRGKAAALALVPTLGAEEKALVLKALS